MDVSRLSAGPFPDHTPYFNQRARSDPPADFSALTALQGIRESASDTVESLEQTNANDYQAAMTVVSEIDMIICSWYKANHVTVTDPRVIANLQTDSEESGHPLVLVRAASLIGSQDGSTVGTREQGQQLLTQAEIREGYYSSRNLLTDSEKNLYAFLHTQVLNQLVPKNSESMASPR